MGSPLGNGSTYKVLRSIHGFYTINLPNTS
jgi:hypothetical protein